LRNDRFPAFASRVGRKRSAHLATVAARSLSVWWAMLPKDASALAETCTYRQKKMDILDMGENEVR
jgi:hypothetical protein